MDIFREYTKIVDDIYSDWLEAKTKYDDRVLDVLSDQIYLSYELDVKYSEFPEKKEYWFDKFKDEEIIINKLKKGFVWWKQ